MSPTRLCALWCVLHAACCSAGHGLINSFAGIDWLPPAGTTPADWSYPLERWYEATDLAIAADDATRLTKLQSLARERLAECEALVRSGDVDRISIAAAAYREHLAAARLLVEGSAEAARPAALAAWATTLLEHRYIVSTDYFDLPRNSRPALAGVMDIAIAEYTAIRQQLPRRVQESLFFKEEEVRWSWEQALGADAQGL